MSCLVASEIGCFWDFLQIACHKNCIKFRVSVTQAAIFGDVVRGTAGQFIVKPLWIFRSAYSIVVLIKFQTTDYLSFY